jgi:hypothetical protein
MRWIGPAALALLAACAAGKGPQYIREPQVKTCTCEKCSCPHCARDMGAICYCGDKDKEGKAACECGKRGPKTCRCDHCVGYQEGGPKQKGCDCGGK